MRYVINISNNHGTQEFSTEEEALLAAEKLLEEEPQLKTIHGYKQASSLIDERWDSLEEMYAALREE